MLYKLNDKLSIKNNTIYGLQHVVFIVLSTVVMPVVVGPLIGLSQNEIAGMLQRTFIISGIISILQIKFGHGYPIVDAPAGLWIGVLTLMAGLAPAIGKSLPTLRTDLEGGWMIAGTIIILITLAGWIPRITKLFTPAVNCVLIILMSLQISPSIMKGMLGITSTNETADFKVAAVSFSIVTIILMINIFGKGFFRSISTLIGILTGWILAALIGINNPIQSTGKGWISLPEVFAWGKPTFDPGITATCVISSFVLLSMVYTSIKSMEEVMEDQVPSKRWNQSFIIHGLTTSLSGVFSIVAFMPYLSSTGFLAMTGVAARSPFLLAGALMILLGMITPLAMLLATIPMAVGCGALVVIFSLILGQGLNELRNMKITNRESFVIGLSLLVGVGMMFLPATAFQGLPSVAAYILPNGLVVGILLALILDNILPKKN